MHFSETTEHPGFDENKNISLFLKSTAFSYAVNLTMKITKPTELHFVQCTDTNTHTQRIVKFTLAK